MTAPSGLTEALALEQLAIVELEQLAEREWQAGQWARSNRARRRAAEARDRVVELERELDREGRAA